ncbi:MAG: MarP family serine protease [Acidimicrobiia bacterium]|nr:MarP family serine protease [Acidimicrobiia bacterium]
MNLLDVFIAMLLIGAAAWGLRTGFTIQVGTYLGLIGGAMLGALLAAEISNWASSATGQMTLALFTVALLATLLGGLGGQLGARAEIWVRRAHLGTVDSALGLGVALAGILTTVWLLAAPLATLPRAEIGRLIQESRIVRWLDDTLPPVPEVAARLGRITDPLGLPRVFAGLERAPAGRVTPPTDAEVAAAAALAQNSTVKIASVGCGALRFGSGFVVAPGLVMTNAHVVAGAGDLTVSDTNGNHRASAVAFDPRNDLAVLSTRGLAGPPLALSEAGPERNDAGAVLGYPNGGNLVIGSAAVRATYSAVGRDIYGTALVTRSIVELQASITAGDSGGPFVLADGTVAGVVFARSVTDSSVGYAIAASTARSDLALAVTRPEPVSTGPCAAG